MRVIRGQLFGAIRVHCNYDNIVVMRVGYETDARMSIAVNYCVINAHHSIADGSDFDKR